MKREPKIGETVSYSHVVSKEDMAAFHGKMVHPVYSTFAIARDAEYTTRQFVLAIIEADEEGVGISLSVSHKHPAFLDEKVVFNGEVTSYVNGILLCRWEARVGQRLIANGETGQKLMKKTEIGKLFNQADVNG